MDEGGAVDLRPDEEHERPARGSLDHTEIDREQQLRSTGNATVERGTASLDGERTPVELVTYRTRGDPPDADDLDDVATAWDERAEDHRVPGLYGWGVADGTTWVATEAAEGGTLSARLKNGDDVLWADEVLWVASELADTLETAHEVGRTHLALDPSTVRFRETGADHWNQPILGGWGLECFERERADGACSDSVTYLAPEQFDTELGDPDERTDQYRLGALTYTLLTGEPPFAGSGYEQLGRKTAETPRPPSERDPTLPEALDEPLLTALEPDPDDRYDSTRAFADALAAVDLPASVRSSPTSGEWLQPGAGPGRRGYAAVPGQRSPPEAEWQARASGAVEGAPAVAYGTVYVTTQDGDITAYALDTGEQRWSMGFEDAGFLEAAPVVESGTVYCPVDESVVALDAQSGRERWRTDCGATEEDDLAVADGTIFVADDVGDAVRALDTATGDERWTTAFDDARMVHSPAADDERAYVASSDAVHALDAETGEEVWRFAVDDPHAPAVGDGVVYVGGYDDTVYAVDAAAGTPEWHAPTEREPVAAPAIDEDTVYVATGSGLTGHVYAIDADGGDERWVYDTDGEESPSTAPVVVEDTVYVGGDSADSLFALAADTGSHLWSYEATGAIEAPPAVADDLVVLASAGGDVYGLVSDGDAEVAVGDEAADDAGVAEDDATQDDADTVDPETAVLELIADDEDDELVAESVAAMVEVPEEEAVAAIDSLVEAGELERRELGDAAFLSLAPDDDDGGPGDRIVEVIETSDEDEMMPAMIAAEAGLDEDAVTDHLESLEAEGRVETREMGAATFVSVTAGGDAAAGDSSGGGDRPDADALAPHLDDPDLAAPLATVVENADADGHLEFADVMGDVDGDAWGELMQSGHLEPAGEQFAVSLPPAVDFEF